MFTLNDDLSIYATRGDIVAFSVSAMDDVTGDLHLFKPGDVVTIKIYGKKNAGEVVLSRDFPVFAPSDAAEDFEGYETVDIYLDGEDMKIGDIISKPTDYWYEIVLNDKTDPQTIIGYDEDGAKIFRLYPEGGDLEV